MESAGATVAYNQYPVYLGSWVNWSRGKVFGATLTMTRENGNLLIAFTALFVAFVSSRFWRIVCFLLHRHFSSAESRDALHHQRQVILRNSWGPEESAWTLGQLFFAWRSSTRRPFSRILPLLACASICICAFSVAGIFSSEISTAIGDEVLIASTDCGIVLMQGGTSHELMVATFKSDSVFASSAANYAQQCYSTVGLPSSSTMFDCNTFATDRLPVTVDTDAPCPFNETMCRSKSNIRLDTGYLDSNEHFGINAPPDERVLFRQVYTCAPLETKGYTEDRVGVHKNFTRYYYGQALLPMEGTVVANFTYEASSIETQYSEIDDFNIGRVLTSQGSVGTITGYTANRNTSYQSTWEPIPEMFRPDGDVSLVFFMGNGLLFNEKSTDDWYRATETFLSHEQVGFVDENPTYRLDEAAAPMGCIEQYQFCRASLPEDSRCGPLASRFDALAGAAPLFDIPEEEFVTYGNYDENNTMSAIFIWLNYMSYKQGGPTTWLLQPGSSALLSQQTMFSGMQLGIAADQWKRDVSHWFSTYLAVLQTSFAEVAAGVRDPNLLPHRIPPVQLQEDKLCKNQKIRSRLHTSFSIFGLSFILVVGGLITITSYILTPIFHSNDQRKHSKRKSSGFYRKDLEWTTNEVLHLHSLSYNPLLDGGAGWSKFNEDIPVLQPGNRKLAPLMFHDEKIYKDEKNGLQHSITGLQHAMTLVESNDEGKGDRGLDKKVVQVQVESVDEIGVIRTKSETQ